MEIQLGIKPGGSRHECQWGSEIKFFRGVTHGVGGREQLISDQCRLKKGEPMCAGVKYGRDRIIIIIVIVLQFFIDFDKVVDFEV